MIELGDQMFASRMRRAARIAAARVLPALLLSGCGIFGGKKGSLPVVNTGTPRPEAQAIAKKQPGLPPDIEHARHTEDELRGDRPALPALTPITTPQNIEGKPG